MQKIFGERYTGERAQYGARQTEYINCIFADGESPLKHSVDIVAENTTFQWKYPLWYAKNIELKNCSVLEMGRAGIWYSDNISLTDTLYAAPKGFRRINGLTLKNVDIPNASETLWHCSNISLDNISAKGDYFGMNCSNLKISNFRLYGNYSFDGCRNVEVHNAKFMSKDAFWNCENVTVYDSYITGEYLAWNSKNVTFINCVIESLQGLCYIDNLVMKNCRLINTTYSFEYSNCEVKIDGRIDSILNPSSGVIEAEEIGNLILEKDRVDPGRTSITAKTISKRSEKPDWI